MLGLGPIGDMACRVALQRGAGQVFGVDLVPERLRRARARGVETFDLRDFDEREGPDQRDPATGPAAADPTP